MASPAIFIPCARDGANINPYGSRAINKDGRTLDLCGHHTREHLKALEKQGWTVTPIAVVLAQRELVKAEEPA